MTSRSQLKRIVAQGGMITVKCLKCGCVSQTKAPFPKCLSCDSKNLELVKIEREP